MTQYYIIEEREGLVLDKTELLEYLANLDILDPIECISPSSYTGNVTIRQAKPNEYPSLNAEDFLIESLEDNYTFNIPKEVFDAAKQFNQAVIKNIPITYDADYSKEMRLTDIFRQEEIDWLLSEWANKPQTD